MTKTNWAKGAVFVVVVLLVLGLGFVSLVGLFGVWGPGMMGGRAPSMMGPGMMGGRGSGMMGYGYGGGALGWFFSLFSMVFLLGLLVLGGAWLVRRVSQPLGPSAGRPGTRLGQTCPSCNRAIQADWQLCAYCGQGLV